MQIQKGFTDLSAMKVAEIMWKTEGMKGFFRGCVPPLWGSMVYRGIMMSGYEYGFTYFEKNYDDDSVFKREVFFGARPMVACASVFAALLRAVVESKCSLSLSDSPFIYPAQYTHIYVYIPISMFEY